MQFLGKTACGGSDSEVLGVLEEGLLLLLLLLLLVVAVVGMSPACWSLAESFLVLPLPLFCNEASPPTEGFREIAVTPQQKQTQTQK